MHLRMGIPAGWIDNLPGEMTEALKDSIFKIKSREDFWEAALGVFNYQSAQNEIYKQFLNALGKEGGSAGSIADIPFLPVEFFRRHKVLTGSGAAEKVFESSGTTGALPSKHYVSDLRLYERSFSESFRLFYGDPAGYRIIALLPSYTERGGSSLVYMADRLIRDSRQPLSGFYKGNDRALLNALKRSGDGATKILLIGVSFALLDLAERWAPDLSGVIVMETGGMKGRRKEIIRQELHDILKERCNISSVHSEYGMTELLSQAYSSGGGIFYCPPWMKICIRDPQDPFSLFSQPGKTGGINIADLANINSCSFIATGDLGRLHDDGGFEVLGRFDNSDIRGCNLMAE
jgi:hypothetical protein